MILINITKIDNTQ